MGKMFRNTFSLKPHGQLKPNCPGMIIGRSSRKYVFYADRKSKMATTRHRLTLILLTVSELLPKTCNFTICSIFSNSGHVDWCMPSADTIFKLNTLVMIQTKFGYNWSGSFREEWPGELIIVYLAICMCERIYTNGYFMSLFL